MSAQLAASPESTQQQQPAGPPGAPIAAPLILVATAALTIALHIYLLFHIVPITNQPYGY